MGRPARRPRRSPTALLLLRVPAGSPVVAVGLWWNSNTVAHHFIHRPFFRSRSLNVLFALLPQRPARHPAVDLARPAPRPPRRRRLAAAAEPAAGRRGAAGAGPVGVLLAALAAWFFLTAYLPGYALGLGLCWLHGHYEHARGTISHHGRLYNLLFLNDGYHVEHHARPGAHWTRAADASRRLRRADQPLAGGAALARRAVAGGAGAAGAALGGVAAVRAGRHERAFRAAAAAAAGRGRGSPSSAAACSRARCWSCGGCCRARRSPSSTAARRTSRSAPPLAPAGVDFVRACYDPAR